MNPVLRLFRIHYLAVLTISYAIGIIVSSSFTLSREVIISTAIFATGLCLLCYWFRVMIGCLFISLLQFFALGVFFGIISSDVPASPYHIYNRIQEPTDVVAVGRLLAMPAFDGTTSRVKIDILSIRLGANTTHTPAQGTVLLRFHGAWPAEYTPGTLLAIRAIFQRPSRYVVPGVFDYPTYLAREDIWITGFIKSPAQLQSLPFEHRWRDEIRFAPEKIRTKIGYFIDENTDTQTSGLYRAILLGDRSHIPFETLESFKASGSMHILAISGVHVTLVGGLLFLFFYWLLRRSPWLILRCNVKKLAGLLSLPILIGYTLLAGGNSPVVRATIMSSIVITAFCINRPKTLSTLIALGALLILLYSPQAIFTVSFQLSFVAFTSIMLLMPLLQQRVFSSHNPRSSPIQKFFINIANWIIAALLASTAAVLGTAPLVIYHFHRLSLIGPVANLILEPLICLWALPLGFLALPYIFFFPSLGRILFQLGEKGLDLAIKSSALFQKIPESTLWLPTPGPLITICYYSTFLYAISLLVSNEQKMRKYLATLPFAICLLIVLSSFNHEFRAHPESETITFLDVDQGSATVVQFTDGNTMLIDGGGSAYTEESVGQRIIGPFLWHKGITRLDTLVVTHADADHYNGMPFLIEHFSPEKLWVSTLTGGNRHYQEMLKSARARGVQVIRAESGAILHEGTGHVECIANTDESIGSDTTRNAGLVIQLTTHTVQILFPGDIESGIEKELVSSDLSLKSDILLAAHHGSATSNSEPFMKRVDPQLLIVSAGRSRKELFPSQSLKNYCERAQLPIMVTAEAGTIQIEQRGDTVEVLTLQSMDTNPLRRNSQDWIPAQIINTGGKKEDTLATTPL